MKIAFDRQLDTQSLKFGWDEMPLYNKDDDHEVRLVEIGNTVITMVKGRGGWNARDTFAKLPDSMCQSDHYGFVVSGRVNIVTKDGVIECSAGDAYHQAAPHRVEWIEDSMLVEFSERNGFWDTEVIMKG